MLLDCRHALSWDIETNDVHEDTKNCRETFTGNKLLFPKDKETEESCLMMPTDIK